MNIFFSHIATFFLRLLSFFPLRIMYIFSDLFFVILYHVIGYRRKTVQENLAKSFPNKNKKELQNIEKKFFRHLADLFLETIKYRNINTDEIAKRCTIKNREILDEYIAKKQSIICLEAHYGNWEWTTYLNQLVPHEVLSIYKPLHNSVMDKFMIDTREHFGAKAISRKHIFRNLTRREKQGKISAVGLVSDQSPDVNKQTYWREFLNQDTAVYSGAEKMAKIFNMPVLYLHCRKLKRGYYEMEFFKITDTPKELPEHEITNIYIDLIEKLITEKPEYWIWSHKRWKRKRPQQN